MTIKVDLTDQERQNLRKSHIYLKDLHLIKADELAKSIKCTKERAHAITAMAQFQQIPSIGYRMAYNLVHYLNIYSLDEIKNEDPKELFDHFEKLIGEDIDPCVEDQIRCVIHHANQPYSDKQWFDFTERRKTERLNDN
ncbi:Pathogenicity locus [Filobacillus milosensis]|uniref:Pathogenicity locus n=1 Tax=Filobacillus milosensis TaxID=94137 RepID=A0A4Y8II63_9BACI|nr:helix-hairpin-helix domain-containing protein [Filobacillus milosensis]TFB19498.1 Pathogenicity locus [Filobacillus milosensis]